MVTSQELREGYREGTYTSGEFVSALTDLIESGNVDELLAELTPPERDLVVDHWRDLAHQDLTDVVLVESVCAPDVNAYMQQKALRTLRFLEVTVPAIRQWVSRNPLPVGRGFPIDLAEAALTRVSVEIERNCPLPRVKGRARRTWESPEHRERYLRAMHLSAALHRALEHARAGIEGDQRQAIAWEILARFSHEILTLDDWQASERAHIEAARAMRGD